MKNTATALLVLVGMAALMASGCANKEAVKTEAPVPVTAKVEAPKAAPVEPAKPEAPKAQSQPKAEAPKVVEQTAAKASATAASFETAYFDFDKSELRKDAREVLSKNADILLKDQTNVKIKIEGHCDERGSAEYNLALGERRAQSALQYLLTLGVKADRMSVVSYGKEKPAVQGSDEAAWAKNRRAEFVVAK